MDASLSVDRSTAGVEAAEELAERVRAAGAAARPFGARLLSLPGAAFAGARR